MKLWRRFQRFWRRSKGLEAIEGCGGGRKLWRRSKAVEEVKGSGGSTARSSGDGRKLSISWSYLFRWDLINDKDNCNISRRSSASAPEQGSGDVEGWRPGGQACVHACGLGTEYFDQPCIRQIFIPTSDPILGIIPSVPPYWISSKKIVCNIHRHCSPALVRVRKEPGPLASTPCPHLPLLTTMKKRLFFERGMCG
jgi:hypothetical protein